MSVEVVVIVPISGMVYPFDEAPVLVDGLLVPVDAGVGDGGARDVALGVDGAALAAEVLERAAARL